MSQRHVTATVRAVDTPEGAGARVKRALPNSQLGVLDPFVLLDEFFVQPPAGFPEHPHRGFEIVTYVLEGGFGHRDSAGNVETVSAGGLQKINTGRGMSHSEMPVGTELGHGLQLWINLAKAQKSLEPEYQTVPALGIPEVEGPDNLVRTIVGDGSPVTLHTPVLYLDVTLQPGAQWGAEVPRTHNGFVYVLRGSGRFGPEGAPGRAGEMLALGEGDSLSARAEGDEPLRFALIAGEPHNEPIRLRGPYVD